MLERATRAHPDDGARPARPARTAIGHSRGRIVSQLPYWDRPPDVRDGLTPTLRLVLRLLRDAQRERGGRSVPTALLYGRVLEHMAMSEHELMVCLGRLGTD